MSYCRSFKRLTIFLMNFQWIQWSLWHHSLDCVHSSYWISWHLSNSRLACLSCCSWGHHLVRAGDFGFIVCFKHFLVFESHLKIDFRMLILTTDSALNEVCSFEHYIFITSLFGSRIFQAVSISLCTADKYLFYFFSLSLYFFYAIAKVYRRMISGLREELSMVICLFDYWGAYFSISLRRVKIP